MARAARGRGAGRLAMAALIAAAQAGRVLEAGLAHLPGERGQPGLMRALGFREVGVYEKHAQLDGVWKDVVIVERLIAAPPRDQATDY